MKENENIVSGYSFSNVPEYKEAKQEAETIEYIKANTNLNDINKVIKLYQKLNEKHTLKTIVGYGFLKQLQDEILKSGTITQENMQCISVISDKALTSKELATSMLQNTEHKFQKLADDYRIRHRNARIINIFLAMIIIVMIIITIVSDKTAYKNYQVDVLNQYATWEEDLSAKEKALEERELAIEQNKNKE